MDKINEFLKNNYKEHSCSILGETIFFPENTKRLYCNDGFSVSVQASENHYCMPRKNKAWPYSEVELGYPNELDEIIEYYAEDEGITDTVFGYVPIEIVNFLIEKHGGIKED